jgi:glycine oxidase
MNATRSHIDERIVVIGGGLIGLAVAWQLARRGRSVSVFERDTAGRGASWVAAGMLAPVSEFGFENEDFLAFGRRSGEAYPAFLDELRTDSGLDVAIDTRGTLVVGLHRDEVEQIRRVYSFREDKGLPVQWLSGTEARELEPLLSPKVSAAMWIPDDHQIDNRALVAAVKEAFIRVGGELQERTEVLSLRVRDGRCGGVVTAEGEHAAGTTVLAAGCWSSSIRGIPPELAPNVRPVKGQIVSLKTDPAYPFAHVIRTPDVYLLPKGTSRVLIGATEEEMGFDVTPTAGPVMRLIERAWEAVPSVYDLPIESIDAGLRPGTRDHEPLIGESGLQGLIYATGHYRHGILLAPVTAYAVSELLVSGKAPEWLEPFAPSRFHNRDRRVARQ